MEDQKTLQRQPQVATSAVVCDLAGATAALREEWSRLYDEWLAAPWWRPIRKATIHGRMTQAWHSYKFAETAFFNFSSHTAEVWDGDPKAPPSR